MGSSIFHFVIKIRNLEHLTDLTTLRELSNLEELSNEKKHKTVHDIVSHQFRKFFQSYSMAFNKQYNRIGTLFQTPFKRSKIDNEEYLKELVGYIHTNAMKHNLVSDFRNWRWSSYSNIISKKETKLLKNELINYFDNVEIFINYHIDYSKKIEPIERDFFIEN